MNNIIWEQKNDIHIGSIYEQPCLYIQEYTHYGASDYRLYMLDNFMGGGSSPLNSQKQWLEGKLIECIERRDLFEAIEENNFDSEYLFNLLDKYLEYGSLFAFKSAYVDAWGNLSLTPVGKTLLKQKLPRYVSSKNEIKKLMKALDLL